MDKLEVFLKFQELVLARKFAFVKLTGDVGFHYKEHQDQVEEMTILDGRRVVVTYGKTGADLEIFFKNEEERLARSRYLRPHDEEWRHEKLSEKSLKVVSFSANFSPGEPEMRGYYNLRGEYGLYEIVPYESNGTGRCVVHEEGYRLMGFEEKDDPTPKYYTTSLTWEFKGKVTPEYYSALASWISVWG